jgi:Sulfatase
MNVSEEATTVCSPDLCQDQRLEEPYPDRMSSMTEDLGLVWLHVVAPPDMESELTSVSENWGNFAGAAEDEAAAPTQDLGPRARAVRAKLNGGRPARFQEWIDSIRPGRRPALNFKHTLLPHVPWQYLPSGRRYRRQPNDAIPGLSNQAYEDQGQLDVLFQRHMLQTQFTDLQLQNLWDKLKSEGMWDDSLIVVAADHGVAFPKDDVQRRRLTRETAAEIAPIPLFIKAPGQKQGEVDDAYVETIDILPTIFDILSLDPKVEMDGKSAFSDEVQSRDELRFLIRNSFEVLRIPADEFAAERRVVIDRNQHLVGSGVDGPARPFQLGPNQELIGKPAAAAGEPLDVELSYAAEYRNVDPATGYVPAHVVGKLNGPDQHPRDIAIAVNGTIVAVGNTFELVEGEDGELVSVMVPETAFRKGSNDVQVLPAP